MKTLTQYPWALVYGLYMYVVFQLMFFAQFGIFNLTVNIIDLGIYIVGVVSVLLTQFFMQKLQHKQLLMLIPFLVALPFGYFGALGGGLLGIVGMVIFGLIPFVVIVPLGYLVLKAILKRREASTQGEQAAVATASREQHVIEE